MHKISTKLFLILLIGWWALVFSLFFRGQIDFISSSFVWDIYNPEQTEEPYPTEPPITTDCSQTHAISWPRSVSFTEASWSATYRVNLNRPSDSQAKISSITVKAKPKNTPAINVAHPADGSGANNPWMTWSTQSINTDGLSAIIRSNDYAWYGTSGTDLCFKRNDQSIYAISVQATLDNGCILNTDFDMEVKFVERDESGDWDAYMQPLPLLEGPKLWRVTKITTPFLKSMRAGTTIYRACLRIDDLTIKSGGVAVSTLAWQYKDFSLLEEQFHLKQTKWEKTWDDGGLRWIEWVASRLLSWQNICADSTSEEESKRKVREEFARVWWIIVSILVDPKTAADGLKDRGAIDIQKYIDYAKSARCWKEKTAKDNIGLTDNIGAFHLACAYPSCNNNMAKPKNPVDMMNDNFTELHRAIYWY